MYPELWQQLNVSVFQNRLHCFGLSPPCNGEVRFLVWMFFFDTNSFFIHQELNDDIKKLENNKKVYQEEIKNDKVFIDKMKDSNEIEKFAREKYYLKKENEDIYIIEHEDSIKNKNNE